MSLTNAIMDIILMGLLAVAIWVGLRVHKSLTALRAGQEQFAKVVHELDAAAIRAHAALKDLRANAEESQDLLHGRIMAARELIQKLDGHVTRAERVQRDLETGVSNAAAIATITARPVTAMVAETLDLPRETMMRHKSPIRGPFDRDVVRDDAPPVQARQSRLPEVAPEAEGGDEAELLEKVHMSELVVANLNEMIRTLNLPTRQPQKTVMSVEEDLFGGDAFKK